MDRKREFAIAIVDLFEELLDEKNIDIPSDDREGNDDEARIYGTEYYELEDAVYELLAEFEMSNRLKNVIICH